jgi:hypothetical protein
MDYSVWSEFDWIPDGLIEKWIIGVKGLHEKNGWGSMPNILWDKDTMVFAGCNKGTMEMLRGATKSWRPSKRREYSTYLLSLQLAIESLGCDFAGWGAVYPDAKRRADKLLDDCFIQSRTRLLDIYMPQRAEIDQQRIREVFGPVRT